MTAAPIWMRLRSGEHLDLLHPDPQGWTDADLAYRLSRTYRWSGDTSWDRPLSVAQHSLTVLAIRERSSLARLSRAERLRELLHDAEEGLLGFDPLAPLKSHLGVALGAVIAPLREALALRYALSCCWDEPTHRVHKWADRTAAASEAKHIVGWSDAEIVEMLGIVEAPLLRDPLPRQPGFAAWEPWPASLAARLFLNKLGELQSLAVPALPVTVDKPVHVLVTGGCEEIEGVIVRGDRDEHGRWDLDGVFTVRTGEGDLFKVNGWTCSTEVTP